MSVFRAAKGECVRALGDVPDREVTASRHAAARHARAVNIDGKVARPGPIAERIELAAVVHIAQFARLRKVQHAGTGCRSAVGRGGVPQRFHSLAG